MSEHVGFTRTDGQTLVGPNGVVVEIPGPFALVYRERERSVRFRIEDTYIFDVVLTYLIYAPERLVWQETGVEVTREDFKILRRNVVEALKLFNGIGLFIAPSGAPLVSEEATEHVY